MIGSEKVKNIVLLGPRLEIYEENSSWSIYFPKKLLLSSPPRCVGVAKTRFNSRTICVYDPDAFLSTNLYVVANFSTDAENLSRCTFSFNAFL